MSVAKTTHGPFQRIVLTAPGEPRAASASVYRIGDLLVDTAGSRFADALVAELSGAPPRRIVCTHQHEDHTGGAQALRRAFGAIPVHAPRFHIPLLATMGRVPEYRRRYWGAPEPIPDAIPYDPGDVFEAAGVALEALATPGHTPGHVAFVAKQDDAVFALTGDLYVGARPLVAWFESAAADLAHSCRLVANYGAGLCMLPTHGRVREDGARSLNELADLLELNAARVESTASRLCTRDPYEVANALFGEEDGAAVASGGEFSYAAFARSVLDPVRALPASPLPIRRQSR